MRDVLFLIHVVSYAIVTIIAQSGAVVKIDAIVDDVLRERIAQLAHHGAPKQRAKHHRDQANDGANDNVQYIVRRQ